MENKDNEIKVSLDEILDSYPSKDENNNVSENDEVKNVSESTSDNTNVNDINTENDEISVKEASTEEPSDESNISETTASENNSEENDDEYNEEDEEEEEYHRKKKKRRRKRHHGRFIFGLLMTTFIIVISLLLSAYIIKFSKDFLGIDKIDTEIVVEIPMNSTTEDIANILYNDNIIDSTYLFRFYSRVKGSDGTFVAGSHTLSPSMTYEEMIEELQTGAVDERESVNIAFPEGITLYEAAQKIEEKGVCDADDFIRAFNTADYGYDFEKEVKVSALKFYKMEGYLFPDTYTFYVDEDAKIAAKKFCKNFQTKITPDLYGRMDDLGMELEEVLTLASMVQAEAQTKSDMKKVASVFLNRLNNPDEYPLLQSDPTRNYVEDIIMPNIEVPSKDMYTAYNTYEGSGLPPGPICNPGLDAINAVLYPAEADYYYFCANLETGEVLYAATLSEHEQNLVTAGLV